MSEHRPTNPEPDRPAEKLKLTVPELLLAKRATENDMKRQSARAGSLRLDDLHDDLQAGFKGDTEVSMTLGLEYALGRFSNIYYQSLDEAIQIGISHLLNEQLEGKEPSVDIFDSTRSTRPIDEIVEAQKILRRKIEDPEHARKVNALYMDRDLQLDINSDARVSALWRLEGQRGNLEAFDFILGEDNQIAQIVEDSRGE